MVPYKDSDVFIEAVSKMMNHTPGKAVLAIKKDRQRAENFRIKKRVREMAELFSYVPDGRI